MNVAEPYHVEPYHALSRLAKTSGGLLIVGHGTRLPAGQEQLKQLVSQMQALCPDTPMQASFLELADPDIATGLKALVEQSIRSVIVVPILLFAAGQRAR